jgi:hypothetical protein
LVGRAKAIVIVALLGSASFGLFLGYEAWTNDSFPAQVRSFNDYANMTGSTFNGTEYSFTVSWKSGEYLPLFAQVTSTTSDSANTPVCSLGLTSVQSGQSLMMPFKINGVESSLSNVQLAIAVRPAGGGSEFTILYNVTSVVAVPGDISPSGYSCEEPSPQM